MAEFDFPNNQNIFDEGWQLLTSCPVCHNRFAPLRAQVVEEKDNAHLLLIKCHHCSSSILALISANQMGISSVGLITDLDGFEVSKFKNASPINSAEVIEILKSFS